MTRSATIASKHASRTGLIVGVVLIVLTLVIAVIVAKPGSEPAATVGAASSARAATTATTVAASGPVEALTAPAPNFDFGSVSMAAGNVTHRYWFRNDSDAPVLLKRIYTSCMCTTATLVKSARVVGSYGMPGHGPMPDVNESFAPGEAAYVDVVFDPAAHGPAGLGPTERVVSIESAAGQRLQLAFVANVRP